MLTRHWFLISAFCWMAGLAACAPAAGPAPIRYPATSAPAATAAVVVQTQIVAGTPQLAVITETPGDAAVDAGSAPAANPMIIKNADIELLVPDTKQALGQITQMAADDGGYIVSSQTWLAGNLENATLQMAVPAVQFEAALNTLRNTGNKVLKEDTSGQDVSAQYTDLQSQLDNLEATSARVRTFLDASKSVQDSLNVNSQLSELEGQIEQIKGQMKYYEGRSAFSLISVTLTPVVVTPAPTPSPTPTREPAWSPVTTLGNATSALSQVLRVSTDIIIWLVVLTSPLTIAGALVWIGLRSFGRRPKSRA